ncbi:MAG: hypothetical protein M1150_01740 [Patescibacteria group bacterium]|nr:hypothetical protein [Patescibacteria group bacterium]
MKQKLLWLVMLPAVIGLIVYNLFSFHKPKILDNQKKEATVASESNDVLDCSENVQKQELIDELSSLIDQSPNDSSCLFIGCSNFF